MTSPLTGEQLAALYDTENTWAADDDFFLACVNERPDSRVLDLGCGTGRLTLAIAAAGHRVVGIDPDSDSLAAAQSKPGASTVDWIGGTSSQIPVKESFDVAIMTSHVAQAISDDDAWAQTLDDVHRSLVPGGRLAFDSRDPAARVWERWTPASTHGSYTLPDGMTIETWIECTAPDNGLVTMTEYRVCPGILEETETMVLAFRSEEQLRNDLTTAGFTVERVLGGWSGQAVGAAQGELIVIAVK